MAISHHTPGTVGRTFGWPTVIWSVVVAGIAAACGACDFRGKPAAGAAFDRQARVLVDPPDSLVAYLGQTPRELAYPIALAVSAQQGHAYIGDMGGLVVRQFTLGGDFVRDYGTGRGEGPGEFLSLTDVEVDNSGQVWTLDPMQDRIQVFDQAGTVIETIRTPGNATAFERTPDGDVVVMVLDSLLFRVITREGSVVRNFGRLADDQMAKAIAIWGFVDGAGSSVFYSGAYGGFLGRWSVDDGALQYLRPSVVEQPFPTPINRNGILMVAPDDRTGASFGLAVAQDTLYVLGSEGGRNLVDVYEAAEGKYQYSIPLPESDVAGLSVTTDHLLLTLDTLVAVWSRHSRGEDMP